MYTRKRYNKQVIALLLCVAFLLCACGPRIEAATMQLTKTEGTVEVYDGAGREITPGGALGLYSGYGLATHAESYAWIALDDVKLTKMDAGSEIEITKDGKQLELRVLSGGLFFNITEPLDEDETLDIRTSSMLVGIRGTCGWVTDTTAALLEGTVEITAGEQTVTISAGEMAVPAADGGLEVRALTAGDIPPFVVQELLEDEDLLAVASALTGEDFSGGPSGGNSDGPSGGNSGGGAAQTQARFIPWAEAGLADHVMDWRDDALAAAMAEITGISGDIMLSDVWELTQCWAGSRGITDISALGELTNLTSLDLGYNQNIQDISALRNLTNLTYLHLGGNSIQDISALSGLVRIQNLYLGENQISDLSPLRGLTDMMVLSLGNNNIRDISPLSGMTRLQILWLSGNEISDISAVSGMTQLNDLQLSYNQISDISPLRGLTSPTILMLFNNQISDISPLAGMTNLEQLGLSDNEIADVAPLRGLTNLTFLRLDGNHIRDVSALSGLVNLETLYLFDNEISDFSPVEFVPGLLKTT